MSEIPKIKLNLKAMGSTKDTSEDLAKSNKTGIDSSAVPEIEETKALVDVPAFKNETPVQKTQEEISDAKLKDAPLIGVDQINNSEKNGEKDGNNNLENVEKGIKKEVDLKETVEEVDNSKKNFIKLASINKYVEEKEEKRQKNKASDDLISQENEKVAEQKGDSESEVHFSNYTSYFENQSKNVFKKIQKFRYAPKTRNGLLLSLIVFTGIIIVSLMVLFPEKHSLSLYKASILEIYEQGAVTKGRGNTSIGIEDEFEGGNNDNLQDEIDKDIEDSNNDVIEDEIDQIKNDKLREHLLNKYAD